MTPQVGAGPVAPTAQAVGAFRPLGVAAARITGGSWAERQRVNREVSIPQGGARLREAGNLDDLALAAAGVVDPERFRGPWFMDSDIYKWLEAVAWEQAREPSDSLAAEQREVTAAVAAAQLDDGYVNSHVQVKTGLDRRYTTLEWSHELYCAGHLIQAAVAQHRATGDRTLLDVAVRFADHLADTFGWDRLDDVDGHPVVEMALVELYRETGDRRYLDLAGYTVDARGRSLTVPDHDWQSRDATYFSDRVPVREQTSVEGHAVRAVYLAAGAADLAAETGDEKLLDALRTQWQSMVDTKTYVTGGLGSRWEGESFGDPYELPPDRAYGETCAAIGSIQWSWRMLLATGEAGYADLIERQLYNAFLPGVSLDGEEFFYVNALQVREGAHADDQRNPVLGRRPWFRVACCPPNIMRTISQLGGYLATSDDAGVQLQQYATGTVEAAVGGGTVLLAVRTDYPWDGRVEVEVRESPEATWSLSLRVPAWAEGATLEVAGQPVDDVRPGGYVTVDRTWRAGDRAVLVLPMTPRLTAPHERVDAARGCLAIERGPLVYCLEQPELSEQAGDAVVDDVRIVPGDLTSEHRPDLLGGVTVVHAAGRVGDREVQLTAVPYLAWANRRTAQGVGPMRVWIPVS